MKVLLPEGKELNEFEKQLQKVLEQANLAGYALMGFEYQEVGCNKQHEIDALVLIEPGIFACLEAKGYKGRWTGSTNTKWLCNGREIRSCDNNPYKQANGYSLVIKNKLNQIYSSWTRTQPILRKAALTQNNFDNIEFYVNSIVVAPDNAIIEIQDAVVDRFEKGKVVRICHCSQLEQILKEIPEGWGVKETVIKLGGLEKIVYQLAGVSIDEITGPDEITDPDPQNSGPSEPTEQPATSTEKKTTVLELKKYWSIAAGVIYAAGVVTATAFATQYFFSNPSCEVPTETRVDNICYKDLARTPLRIGILSSPDKYENFRSYLKEQLASQALEVAIEGNADISYTEAQNKIAKQEWDIIFALSPMNGMRAKDNGYVWVARMFPQLPPTYQAALYVRANSRIQSLNDINTTTRIALGDFNSASSFYMPVYDLYGKSMNVTAGHRSSKIRDLVAGGIVDMGAGVYSFIKDDPKFRIIHVSREIPGSGVYFSPKIAPKVQEQLRQILMNAPEDIKEEANYGEGQEPNYEPFRAISLRSDEVLGCADFDRQPVQFFCGDKNNQQAIQPQEKLTGTITGLGACHLLERKMGYNWLLR